MGKLKKMYRELIAQFFIENGIEEANIIGGYFAKSYYRLRLTNDNEVVIYLKGYMGGMPMSFDYTLDYANLIASLENDLFFVQRNSKPTFGFEYKFEFKDGNQGK